MVEPKSSGRWTSFFRRKDLEGEDFFGRFLGAISKIFEGANEEETFRTIRSELVRVFDCDDLSLYFHDPAVKPGPSEGEWVLQKPDGEEIPMPHAERLYTPVELARMARRVGLEPEGLAAGLRGGEWSLTSLRLVFIARRYGDE